MEGIGTFTIIFTMCFQFTRAVPTVYIGYIIHNETEDADGLKRAFEEKMLMLNENRSLNLFFEFGDRRNITDVHNSFDVMNKVCSIIYNRIVALVVVGTSSSDELFSSVARRLEIPVFMPTEMSHSMCRRSSYVMTMTPSFVQAIVDIMRFFRWDAAVYYIYDSNEGLMRLQEFYKMTSRVWRHNELMVHPLRITNITDSYDLLRSVDRADSNCTCTFTCPCAKRIILDLSTKYAFNQTLEQIINVGMNRDGYHYILGTLGIDDLDLSAFEYGGVNITGFSIVNQKYTQRQHNKMKIGTITYKRAMVMDTLEFIAKGITTFRDKNRQGLTNLYQRQPINCSSDYVPKWMNGFLLKEIFKETRNDNGYTGTIQIDETGARKGHTLDVHQLAYRTPLRKIGTWSPNVDPDKRFQTHLRSPLTPYIPGEQDNKTWIITTRPGEPFFMKVTKTDIDRTKAGYVTLNGTTYEGYCVEVAEKIKARYEKKFGPGTFNYQFRTVADNEFGQYNKSNGRWNGMIGELIDKKADMALSSLTINEERQRVVDFTKPFLKMGISIMIKKPDKQKPGVFSFMKPLSKQVWMCVVVAFLGVSVVLFFVGRWSPYEWQPMAASKEQSNAFSFPNTLWFALGALMQQGSDIFPRSLSGRVVGSAWWFFTLILISSYTANLAAFLTIERLLTPIKNVDDLAQQTEIEYGIRANGATEAFFRNAKIEVYQRLWTFMESNRERVIVNTDEEGIARVRNGKGKYAYLLESPKNDFYSQKKPCNTMRVGDLLDNKGYGIATPQDSVLRKNLNLVVLELREEGILHKLQQKWWYDKGECGSAESKDTTKSALTLSNVSGIFHILIAGLVLSMMVSLMEHLIHRLQRKRKERLQKLRMRDYKPAVKIEKKNPLEVLKAAGYTEHENNAYTFNPPDQLTTFDSGNRTDV